MRDSIPGGLFAVLGIICCALPLLLISGALTFGGGFVLNQQLLIAVGIVLILLAGVAVLVVRSRGR